jgi:hypothetical protein
MFFMLAANHLGFAVTDDSHVGLYWIVALIIILGIGGNGVHGKMGPMKTIKGVITSGFVLSAIFVALLTILM